MMTQQPAAAAKWIYGIKRSGIKNVNDQTKHWIKLTLISFSGFIVEKKDGKKILNKKNANFKKRLKCIQRWKLQSTKELRACVVWQLIQTVMQNYDSRREINEIICVTRNWVKFIQNKHIFPQICNICYTLHSTEIWFTKVEANNCWFWQLNKIVCLCE